MFPERPRPATMRVPIPNMGISHCLSLGLSIVDTPAPGTLVLDLATWKPELLNGHDHQFILGLRDSVAGIFLVQTMIGRFSGIISFEVALFM